MRIGVGSSSLVLSAASYGGQLSRSWAPWVSRFRGDGPPKSRSSSSFANRPTPSNLGGIGINVRFLQRSGVDRTAGVAAMGLDTVAGLIVHVMALVVAFILVGSAGVGDVKLPKGWVVLVAVVVVLAVIGIVLATSVGRRRILVPVRERVPRPRACDATAQERVPSLRRVGRHHRVLALALAASLQAFHADASLTKVAAVYLGGAAIAAVSPTPAGSVRWRLPSWPASPRSG